MLFKSALSNSFLNLIKASDIIFKFISIESISLLKLSNSISLLFKFSSSWFNFSISEIIYLDATLSVFSDSCFTKFPIAELVSSIFLSIIFFCDLISLLLSNVALLTGLLKCRCGSTMRVNYGSKRKDGTRGHYYICSKKNTKGIIACNNKNINGEQLEEVVINQIKNINEFQIFNNFEESKKEH